MRRMDPRPSITPPSGGPRITRAQLFAAFSGIALAGFGGVLPHARRMLVERKRWLSDREMTELLSIGQLLPGPNIVNVGILFGVRRCGALAAAAGLLVAPLVLVLVLGAAYLQFADLPWLKGAFQGVGAVAAGLILGMGARLAHGVPPRPAVVALGAAAFAGVALARVPLAWVVLALAPLGVWLAWRSRA
jgi:chromate transporter